MAKSDQLRKIRGGTVINFTAKKQETDLAKALARVERALKEKFGEDIVLAHDRRILLRDIVDELRRTYPKDMEFHCYRDTSNMRPDGGILAIKGLDKDPLRYPILIAEVKNQGTNDKRKAEGLSKQSLGNAVERLGKNVIGFRTMLMRESIFPFICFGYGCDFTPEESILDRVVTIAMFGKLNKTHLHAEGEGKFNRGSYYFRPEKWSVDEMAAIMTDIAERSVLYYFSKYTKAHFKRS